MSAATSTLAALLGLAAGAAAQDERPPFKDPLAEIQGLAEPSAAVFAREGDELRLFVLEALAGRVSVFDEERALVRRIGARGAAAGELRDPGGLAVDLDGDGEVWVADTGNHRVQVFDPAGGLLRVFGAYGPEPGAFLGPRGIALHGDTVAVADAGNDRVQLFKRDGEFLRVIGARGRAPGAFQRPVALAYDGAGLLYVVDSDNNRVQVFDAECELVRTFGEFGFHPGLFTDPTGIAVTDGRVYVADQDNSRIQVFDLAGELSYWWGVHALRPREAGGRLHYPETVAVAPGSDVAAVVERFENRVQLFVREGENPPEEPLLEPLDLGGLAHFGGAVETREDLVVLVEPSRPGLKVFQLVQGEPIEISRIEHFGRDAGELKRPVDAALDLERDRLLVCDPANGQVAVYAVRHERDAPLAQDPDLARFQLALDFGALHADQRAQAERGGPPAPSWPIQPDAIELAPDGGFYLADGKNRCVWSFSPDFEVRARLGGPSTLDRPVDVAVAPDGQRVYVVDELARVCRVFSPDGASIASFPAADGDALGVPAGVCVDAEGRVFVTDAARHRILRFTPDLEPLATWGGYGLGAGEFTKPRGLAMGDGGELFVLDYGNHRLQILSPAGEMLQVSGPRLFTRPARQGR